MWSEFEREVNRQPYNILASLKAKLSELMADKDRDVVIHPCKMFLSQIETIVGGQWGFY